MGRVLFSPQQARPIHLVHGIGCHTRVRIRQMGRVSFSPQRFRMWTDLIRFGLACEAITGPDHLYAEQSNRQKSTTVNSY